MKLTDEEEDMLAGARGEPRRWAIDHMVKVGEMFDAADLVPVSQAHMMADPESVGDRFVLRLVPARTTDAEAVRTEAFALGAPSPNPTHGALHIPYVLAEAGGARVTMHDALGREVAVVREGAHAAGSHRATLDTRALAPGVYVVRLVAGDTSAMRRVTVVR